MQKQSKSTSKTKFDAKGSPILDINLLNQRFFDSGIATQQNEDLAKDILNNSSLAMSTTQQLSNKQKLNNKHGGDIMNISTAFTSFQSGVKKVKQRKKKSKKKEVDMNENQDFTEIKKNNITPSQIDQIKENLKKCQKEKKKKEQKLIINYKNKKITQVKQSLFDSSLEICTNLSQEKIQKVVDQNHNLERIQSTNKDN